MIPVETALKAQRGSESAFETLVVASEGMVFSVLLGAVGDPTVAEDLTQETFLLAWKNLHRLRAPEAFAMWIRQIARNAAHTWLRRASARRKLQERYHQERLRVEDISQGRGPLADRDTSSEISAALSGLPARVREAVVTYYLSERSVRETAESLGISENAVRKRLNRGRRLMRENLVAAGITACGATDRRCERIGKTMAALSAVPLFPSVMRLIPCGGAGLRVNQALQTPPLRLWGMGFLAAVTVAVSIGIVHYSSQIPGSWRSETPEIPIGDTERVSQRETDVLGEREVVSPAVDSSETAGETVVPWRYTEKPETESVTRRGIVIDYDGNPISGAVVTFSKPGSDSLWNRPSLYAPPVLTTTDSTGHFECQTPAWRAAGIDVVAPALQSQELVGSTDIDWVVYMRPAYTVTGRVLDEHGGPVSGAHLIAYSLVTPNSLMAGVEGHTATQTDGTFLVPLREPGKTILIVNDGMAIFSQQVDFSQQDDTTIRLEPTAAIAGSVTGPDGILLEGLSVRTYRRVSLDTPETGGNTANIASAARVETDSLGGFRLTGLQPRVPIWIEVENEEMDIPPFELYPLSPGEEREWSWTLGKTACVDGRVVDQDGRPLNAVRVGVYRDGSNVASTRTNEEGLFEINLPVSGAYEFRLTYGDYPEPGVNSATRVLEIISGGAYSPEFVLLAPAKHILRAFDPHHGPLGTEIPGNVRMIIMDDPGTTALNDPKKVYADYYYDIAKPGTAAMFEIRHDQYASVTTWPVMSETGKTHIHKITLAPAVPEVVMQIVEDGRPASPETAWVCVNFSDGFVEEERMPVGTGGTVLLKDMVPALAVTIEVGWKGEDQASRFYWTSGALDFRSGTSANLGIANGSRVSRKELGDLMKAHLPSGFE